MLLFHLIVHCRSVCVSVSVTTDVHKCLSRQCGLLSDASICSQASFYKANLFTK